MAVLTVAAVAVVMSCASRSSGSSKPMVTLAEKPAGTSTKPSGLDQRAFPRTLSFWKCDPDMVRRDMVVSYGFCRIGALIRKNPNDIFLLTPGLFPSSGAENGGMQITYGQGLLYWRKGYSWPEGGCDTLPGPVNLGCIRQFRPYWDYMWNADGTIAGIYGTHGHPGWNIVDPTDTGTRELVAKFIAYTAKKSGLYTQGWDGVFSDNWTYSAIGQSWAYGSKLDTDRDGKVDDHRTLRKRWNDGLNEVGNRLRSYLPGKIIAGNGSWYPSVARVPRHRSRGLVEGLERHNGRGHERLAPQACAVAPDRLPMAQLQGSRRATALHSLPVGCTDKLWSAPRDPGERGSE